MTITKIPEHLRALEMVQQVMVIGAEPEFNPWDLGDGNASFLFFRTGVVISTVSEVL